MEASHCGAGDEACGVDVALPVVACYHTALAVDVAACEDGVGPVGCHLTEQQRGAPSKDGVAGRVGTVGAEPCFVGGVDSGLAIVDIGTCAHVVVLGQFASLVGSEEAQGEHAVDGWCVLLRYLEAEHTAVDLADVVDAPDGVGDGDGQPCAVFALLLAPAVLRFVVLEGGAGGVGRRGQEVDGIWHLNRVEQGLLCQAYQWHEGY